jgi:hypothetical protein
MAVTIRVASVAKITGRTTDRPQMEVHKRFFERDGYLVIDDGCDEEGEYIELRRIERIK